jgi:branched-subunit amino acid transport protein
MNELLLLLGMFLVTFGVRYPVLAIVSRIQLPEIINQGLKYIPPAVLMAIITPAILNPEGKGVVLSLSNAPLFAGLIATLVAWRTKNVFLTIVIGMAAFWLWRWLLFS